jgi:hypothetical protein
VPCSTWNTKRPPPGGGVRWFCDGEAPRGEIEIEALDAHRDVAKRVHVERNGGYGGECIDLDT